jgi:predicted transcriptional regulator YdeE
MLRNDLPAAELRGMIRMKQAELEQHIQAEQVRLARVEARLKQIEQEGAMPDYEVVLKTVPPKQVLGIRDMIPGYHDIGPLFEELHAYLQLQNVSLDITRPCIAVYYDAEYCDRGVDAELAAPIPRPLPSSPRAIVHQLPGVETMACVVHQGGYDRLSEAHNSLMSWIEANGYRVIGPNRDVYPRGLEPSLDPTCWVTEAQFPVKEKPISHFITQHKEQNDMEPKIVTKPAFTVVGMSYHGKNQNNEIPQLWGEFIPRAGEIKHVTNPHLAYGVCGELEEDGAFKYVAGFGVDDAADIPEGMVSWEVPEQTYAIFPCTLKTIHETYKYSFKTWLPQSDYQAGDGPDFELYDENFNPEVEGSEMYIYVPIK